MEYKERCLNMWECFCDECYYGMWAVRHTERKGFDQCIHVQTKEEAEFLVNNLNDLDKLRRCQN
jgi:hypothetical protein